MIDRTLRHPSWGWLDDEHALVWLTANLAYHGAAECQIDRLVGNGISKATRRRVGNLLAPNRRRADGNSRSGGRALKIRSIAKLNVPQRWRLVEMLKDYHYALENGAVPAEAVLSVWLISDSALALSGEHEPFVISLSRWILAVENVQKRRLVVSKCSKCGSPNLVLDLKSKRCSGGWHTFVDGGPYFKSATGGDSPMVLPQTTEPLRRA